MPKNKKASSASNSSSDSDSGPDDRNPPPSAKKSKSDTSSANKKNNTKAGEAKNKNNGSNENQWVLEKMRMVSVSEFRGRKLIDIREHYESNGKILPGKKGISLSVVQWKKLLELAPEVNQAIEE